jgi:hypothetical protein
MSNFQSINDSLQLWLIDKNTRILKSKNKTFIWHKINEVDYWKIDENISAFHLIDYKLKLWLKDDSLKIWKENAIKNYSALFCNIENKFKKWQFNDSLQLIFYQDTFSLWKVNPFTKFYKLSFLDNVLYMSDTSKLWLISDSLFLWTKKDSTALWKKKYEPQSWVISSSTKVWNINDSIEYWLTDKKMNFWKENKLTGNWAMLDTVNNWLLGDTSKLYKLDPQTIVINKNEKVCIWKLSNQLVYSILEDKNGKVWKIKPPTPKLVAIDTVFLADNKQVENFYIDNNTQLWNLNDSIKIWRIKEKIEVWQKNNHFKIWQVDDSTKIINLYDKIRLTIFHNKVYLWQRNDSLGEWKKIKSTKQWKYIGND